MTVSFSSTKVFSIFAMLVIALLAMITLQGFFSDDASSSSSSHSIFVHAANVTALKPVPLLDGGILVAVLIGIFMIVVPAGFVGFIPAMFVFILICYFAGIVSSANSWHGISVPSVVAVLLIGIILEPVGRLPLVRAASMWAFGGQKGHRTWQLFKILVGSAIIAAIVPNAPHAQLTTPILRDVAIASGMHPKYVLMPMSIMVAASNFILISSASNLIASGFLETYAHTPLGMGDMFISNIVPTVATIFACLLLSNLMYPQEIDDETLEEIEAGKARKSSEGFMNQTKFAAMFEVFPCVAAEDGQLQKTVACGGQKVSQLLNFLPADLQSRLTVSMVQAVKDSPPSAIESGNNNNTNEPSAAPSGEENQQEQEMKAKADEPAAASPPSGTASPFNILTGDDALDHVLLPGDRIIITSDVNALRSARTLLGLGWVGISETAFHNGLDIVANASPHSSETEEKAQEEKDASEEKPIVEGSEPTSTVAVAAA